ncbi:helix-turn-helix transcriptional regulator [Chitinibacter bivalviorum]|uniref:Helix-turn-helix transcriptional regulator n=1 Tax=Chitinibacter bivalviorum TaxID=2739434 RepID=A0A7H9BJD4_9NEIS|nr:helix-turn-helix transcriptional regulator [Chitinibacter bivalviorum]QLG88777.1 helix-turn-helix transcriptional regulator [Chitinibacter bivalviorum]
MLKSNIKAIALARGIKTARHFSEALKIAGVTMSIQNSARYLKAQPPAMTLKLIDAICKALSCSVGELFSDQDYTTANFENTSKKNDPLEKEPQYRSVAKFGPSSKFF